MASNPIEQLITVVIPALIGKIKEDRDMITALQEGMKALSADLANERVARGAAEDRLTDLTADLDKECAARGALEEKFTELTEKVSELASRTPAPAVKKRVRRKKNLPKPDSLTPLDILRANYALVTTKGDVDWASALMPAVPREKIEYIANMTSAEIDEIYNPDLLSDEPAIDIRYAQTHWSEVPEELTGAK